MPFDGSNLAEPDLVLSVLRQAREHIAQPGAWCQGTPKRGEARCAAAWLSDAVEALPWADRTAFAVAAAFVLDKALPAEYRGCIIGYNDAPERTQADVVALYNRAIAARGGPDAG